MTLNSKAGRNNTEDDYDYLFELIRYLQDWGNIFLFITAKDFDVLYRWWEKGIPLQVIKEAIKKVVTRWGKRNKPITSFANFYYEVKKSFRMFKEMKVGMYVQDSSKKREDRDEIKEFMHNFPPDLLKVKKDMECIISQGNAVKKESVQILYDKILVIFKDDTELNKKSKIFMRNIARELKSDELKRRYKINYLSNKYKIPDLGVE